MHFQLLTGKDSKSWTETLKFKDVLITTTMQKHIIIFKKKKKKWDKMSIDEKLTAFQ